MKKISIGIVDNEPGLIRILQENLQRNTNIDVIFTANSGKDAIDKLDKLLPDVILMDIDMPIMNGITATTIISKNYPSVKVIMLTVMDTESVIFDSIMAGARGYLTKDSPIEKLLIAIEECLDGGAPMSPGIAFKAIDLIKKSNQNNKKEGVYETFGLTNREIEIMEKIAEGKTYKQIGDELFISPSTVRKHIENIYGKLRVHNKTEAINLFKFKNS